MTTDSYVQVNADGSGKKVAAQEITRADGTTVVEVQETLDSGQVNDSPSVLVDGEVAPLSLTPEGRLRVSSVEAKTFLNFFGPFSSVGDADPYQTPNPWGI